MQLQRHGVRADRLDRLGQDQLAAVDIEALALEVLRDVGRRDRAVERIGLADALTLSAVLLVVVLVSLPRLHAFALRENEVDAMRLLERAGKILDGGESLKGIGDLAGRKELEGHLGDAIWPGEGALLMRHGYCFDLLLADGSHGEARPICLRAWPQRIGETGIAAFARPSGSVLLGHRNDAKLWSGPSQPPELAAAGWCPIARIE